jgi:hypothetical protein
LGIFHFSDSVEGAVQAVGEVLEAAGAALAAVVEALAVAAAGEGRVAARPRLRRPRAEIPDTFRLPPMSEPILS